VWSSSVARTSVEAAASVGARPQWEARVRTRMARERARSVPQAVAHSASGEGRIRPTSKSAQRADATERADTGGAVRSACGRRGQVHPSERMTEQENLHKMMIIDKNNSLT
jgi:hypothetical protein